MRGQAKDTDHQKKDCMRQSQIATLSLSDGYSSFAAGLWPALICGATA
jgi:hypothetical protein